MEFCHPFLTFNQINYIMKNIKIIGAGMAGLIAGHMLRRFSPEILEASASMPDNHSALLRFRSNAVSNATSIPFHQVQVRKGIKDRHGNAVRSTPSISDINAYALKVSGVVSDRSISDLTTSARWVAPPDFIKTLAESCPAKIKLNSPIYPIDLSNKPKDEIWISTIPMPVLMGMVGQVFNSTFAYKAISTIVAIIDAPLTSVYQTIYLPYTDAWGDFYRVSIHGNQLIVEGVGHNAQPEFDPGAVTDQQIARRILQELFGIDRPIIKSAERKVQQFGKMVSIDESERKDFIHMMTEEYGIYSLGRYATWRPILLDDVVNDIAVIERLMHSKYERAKA